MNVSSGSDLARLQALQQRAVQTRNALDRSGTELTTGEKASRFDATGGDLTRLFALERSIDRNAVFQQTISLTELRLDVMQEGLGKILATVGQLSVDLPTAVGLGDIAAGMVHARSARNAFADTVATLNTQVAGKALFAGTETDRAAVAPAETILQELDALVAGTATSADAIDAIDEYFRRDPAPSGAFFTTGYLGGTDDLSPVEIGEGRKVDAALRADHDEIVAVLRSQAMAAVVAGGAFAGSVPDRLALLGEAGRQMQSAKDGLLELRGTLGISQNAVEQAKAARVSEADTLELARARIVAVDPLVAASSYQALETQLQTIFTVTSRLANLNFANFMR